MEILKTFEKKEKNEQKYLNKILEVLNNLMSNEKLDETDVKMSNRLEALFNHAIKIVNFKWKGIVVFTPSIMYSSNARFIFKIASSRVCATAINLPIIES